jgi:nucleoside phosphorylase
MNRAVILTALPLEAHAVLAHLKDCRRERPPQGTIYSIGQFRTDQSSWEVAVAIVGPGNARSAQEAERAAQHLNPAVMFFVGVAGGRKDVAIGDVVFGDKVYGYESAKASAEDLLSRPEQFSPSYSLYQLALHESMNRAWTDRIIGETCEAAPQAVLKPIASGEKLVSSSASDIAKLLGRNYGDAVAVEMEGYGFLKTMQTRPRTLAAVVRGISDLLDNKSDTETSGSQERASRNAAAFVFQLLDETRDLTAPADDLPELLRDLHSKATLLVSTRPQYWAPRLLSQVLADEIADAKQSKLDGEYGIAFDRAEIDFADTLPWFTTRFENIVKIVGGVNQLFKHALPDAINSDGLSKDPERVVYCAKKVAEAYKRLLEWRTEFSRVDVQELFRPLMAATSIYADGQIAAIEKLSIEMQSQIDALVAGRLDPQETGLHFSLVLPAPDNEPLEAELKKIRSALGLSEAMSANEIEDAEQRRGQLRYETADEVGEDIRTRMEQTGSPTPPGDQRLPDIATQSALDALENTNLADDDAIERMRTAFQHNIETQSGGMVSAFLRGMFGGVFDNAIKKYQLRTKTVEAAMSTRRLFDSAIIYLTLHPGQYLQPTEWTPPDESRTHVGGSYPVRPELWDHPTWKALNFSVDETSRYAYRFENTGLGFRVSARGDLDGDGEFSLFWREGVIDANDSVRGGQLQTKNELD